MKSVIALALGFCIIALAGRLHSQGKTTVSVRSLMSEEQFRNAGLNKLSEKELAALDAWFTETAVALLTGRPFSPGTRSAALSNDFASLEGASIIADDGQFLGIITTNIVDSRSIGNEIGRYGSTISSTSIFNEIGRYGGPISRMSPFNEITSTPPRIFVGNQFIAYLTVNVIKSPRVDPRALIGWIKGNQ